jgi:hypothetical protein
MIQPMRRFFDLNVGESISINEREYVLDCMVPSGSGDLDEPDLFQFKDKKTGRATNLTVAQFEQLYDSGALKRRRGGSHPADKPFADAKTDSPKEASKRLKRFHYLTQFDRAPVSLTTAKLQEFIQKTAPTLNLVHKPPSAGALKRMLIKGVCSIVLVGVELARDPFIANEQLAQRSEPAIEFRKLNDSDRADTESFVSFLSDYMVKIERTSIVRNAANVLDHTNIYNIFKACDGVLGGACNLIKEAIKIALDDGRDYLTQDDLALATDLIFVAPKLCKTNPFRGGEKSRALA